MYHFASHDRIAIVQLKACPSQPVLHTIILEDPLVACATLELKCGPRWAVLLLRCVAMLVLPAACISFTYLNCICMVVSDIEAAP